MQITDMGEFSEEDAQVIAEKILKLTEELPVPEDPNAGQTRWICSVCGYVHTREEALENCPVCKQLASVFKQMKKEDGV
jgi:rubrerythrin